MDPQELLTDAQPGLEASFDPTYLGNPDVVERLVAEFCTAVAGLIDAGKVGFKAGIPPLITRYADIFSGRSPDYKPMIGYNEVTLPAKLRVDLGPFWPAQRAQWNDDPVQVLLWWLVNYLVDAATKADGDEMLFEVMVGPYVRGVVERLLGIEKRLMPPI